MGKVVNFLTKLLDKVEPENSIELEEIVFSKKYGHELCIMHLVGKNSFPKMTTDEILSNPKARAGLSKEDLITITKLDTEIKLRKNKFRVREFDRNGTLIIEDGLGKKSRYSEKMISMDPVMLDKLNGKDAHGIGYRVGFKEGVEIYSKKQALIKRVFSIFRLGRR